MTTLLLSLGIIVCLLEILGWVLFFVRSKRPIDKTIKRDRIEIFLVSGIFVIAAVALILLRVDAVTAFTFG